MKYLVDTNYIIDFLHGKKEIVKQLGDLFDKGIAISVITVAEVVQGAYKSERPKENIEAFEKFLADNEIPILEIDRDTAYIYGQKQGPLLKIGRRISGFDMLIAATCLKHSLELVTDNIQHFKRIEGIQLFK